MSITLDSEQLQKNMDALPPKLEAAIAIYAETICKDWESTAKRNRPWTDRTSRARQGLTGSSGMDGTKCDIVLAHTVDYGVWLELAHEKRFAIVEPTVRLNSNRAISGLERLLDKVKL